MYSDENMKIQEFELLLIFLQILIFCQKMKENDSSLLMQAIVAQLFYTRRSENAWLS